MGQWDVEDFNDLWRVVGLYINKRYKYSHICWKLLGEINTLFSFAKSCCGKMWEK